MSSDLYALYDECSTCAEPFTKDRICRCSPIAVVCAWCSDPHVIADGFGRVEWEGGDDSLVSHGMCAEALEKELANEVSR